jgi:hypothetical protein
MSTQATSRGHGCLTLLRLGADAINVRFHTILLLVAGQLRLTIVASCVFRADSEKLYISAPSKTLRCCSATSALAAPQFKKTMDRIMNIPSFAPTRFAPMRAVLLFCGLQAFALAATAAPQILGPVPQEKFTLATLKSLSNVYVQTTKTATLPVTFNAGALQNLPVGAEALLSLPNGQQYVYRVLSSAQDRYGNLNWVAALKDVNGKDSSSRYKLIATVGAGGTFATIETPEDVWSIVPGTGSGFDYLVNGTREAAVSRILRPENDAIVVPEDRRIVEPHAGHDHAHDEMTANAVEQNLAPKASNAIAKIAPTPQRNIDVMVVVSQGFANFHGANLEARISQAFAEANAAYVRSEVAISIMKVGPTIVRSTPDPTASASSTDLNTLTNNVGVFADLEDLRWAYGADLVTLFRQPPPNTGSGIAWLGSFGGSGASEFWTASRNMYSVVDLCNFASCDAVIFAHELGHNMGLQHDCETEACTPGTANTGFRPYSYGWKVNSGSSARDFRTIMSYAPPARPVAVFSNPNLFICNPAGFAPADACGIANIADNARALNENRNMIAGIRTAQQVALSTTTTVLSATATTATLQVSRVGAITTAISVDYQTVNGTAVAGIDYAATAGTLTWAANDSSVKTINVPLIYTGTYVDRTFTVSLTNPLRASFTTSDVTLTRQSLRSPGTGCPVNAP